VSKFSVNRISSQSSRYCASALEHSHGYLTNSRRGYWNVCEHFAQCDTGQKGIEKQNFNLSNLDFLFSFYPFWNIVPKSSYFWERCSRLLLSHSTLCSPLASNRTGQLDRILLLRRCPLSKRIAEPTYCQTLSKISEHNLCCSYLY